MKPSGYLCLLLIAFSVGCVDTYRVKADDFRTAKRNLLNHYLDGDRWRLEDHPYPETVAATRISDGKSVRIRVLRAKFISTYKSNRQWIVEEDSSRQTAFWTAGVLAALGAGTAVAAEAQINKPSNDIGTHPAPGLRSVGEAFLRAPGIALGIASVISLLVGLLTPSTEVHEDPAPSLDDKAADGFVVDPRFSGAGFIFNF